MAVFLNLINSLESLYFFPRVCLIFLSHIWRFGLGGWGLELGFLGLYLMGFENSGVGLSRFFGVGAL